MKFEKLLSENQRAVERFVNYRISVKEDAEDILQETYLTAFQKFNTLNNEQQFKAWIISIAKNKCNDYFRKRFKQIQIAEEITRQAVFSQSRYGIAEQSDVIDIISSLQSNDREIINLYYFIGLSQEEISAKLNIPIGTVKSRLHTAKFRFKEKYPYIPETEKGEKIMKLPEKIPQYKIIKSDKEPFNVIWQELMGWLIIPRLGEKISWAMYDFPKRDRTEYVEMEVLGKANVHGIDGVEITAKEYTPGEFENTALQICSTRTFIAQLTDTHCRFLAESHKENGVNRYFTFLDGDEFIKNWGFGADNCGKEINLIQKNTIQRKGNTVESSNFESCMDVVGRYTVIIGNKEFDTICVMDIESYDTGVVTEQYIDKNGKTVLWRRFNSDDWAYNRYQQKWSDKLPYNEQIMVNGKPYVHWYDCISDYIL
ncbi:MAG: RNA polymerase sigma factor [Eubacterium sp.]